MAKLAGIGNHGLGEGNYLCERSFAKKNVITAEYSFMLLGGNGTVLVHFNFHCKIAEYVIGQK